MHEWFEKEVHQSVICGSYRCSCGRARAGAASQRTGNPVIQLRAGLCLPGSSDDDSTRVGEMQKRKCIPGYAQPSYQTARKGE